MNQVNVTSIPKSLIKRSKIHISTKGTFYKRLECPHLSISLTFLYGYRERDGFSQTGRFSKRSSSFWITDWSLIEERIAYKRILLLLYGLLESLWHFATCSAHAVTRSLWCPNAMGNVCTIWISFRRSPCALWVMGVRGWHDKGETSKAHYHPLSMVIICLTLCWSDCKP